jgi:hypothetical protein
MLRSLALVAILCLAGCASKPAPVPYARAFPDDAPRGETLNIQVFQRETSILLTNTTARAFGPCTLWLNMRFSRPLPSLAVGQTVEIPLKDFRDEFQDEFRGGGFFASDVPERLVSAHLQPGSDQDPNAAMLGLVVVVNPSE